jgi:hypothetical protein
MPYHLTHHRIGRSPSKVVYGRRPALPANKARQGDKALSLFAVAVLKLAYQSEIPSSCLFLRQGTRGVGHVK